MNRRGFTVLEIVVTLVVISVLLTVGIYTAMSGQSTYRDRERQADIKAISIALEDYYKREGFYPVGAVISTALKIDSQALKAPGQTTISIQSGGLADANSVDKYIYEVLPVGCDNTAIECRNFRLYYLKEVGGDKQTVFSKN